jgi:hypothetical protein
MLNFSASGHIQVESSFEHGNESCGYIKGGRFLYQLNACELSQGRLSSMGVVHLELFFLGDEYSRKKNRR